MRKQILNLPASKIASVHRSVLEQRENTSKENITRKGKKRENKNDGNIDKITHKTQREEPERMGKIRDGLAYMP